MRGRSADWTFARRPFWLFSHLFALSVVVLFIGLGLWQLGRHGDRLDSNAVIADRLGSAPVVVDDASDLGGQPPRLDYQPVTVLGTFVDGDYVRVVNRSQGGVAGEHVVGVLELADGTLLAVNRGFVPANADVVLDSIPAGSVSVEGWLRESVSRGRLGAEDSGEGRLMPRLNVDDLAARIGQPVAPVWLQAAADVAVDPAVPSFPDPVPLPPLDEGPHLAYAAQWFIFAALGVLFYGALVRRQSRAM